MIKAIIFDFDGTLANTIFSIREGLNATMRIFGFPEHDLAAVTSFINTGARELVRKALPADLQSDEALLDRVLTQYDACYAEVCCDNVPLYDGIADLLPRLKARYKIGVLSNKQDHFVRRLSACILPKNSYDEALGALPNCPTKPDPFLPNRIASMLGVSPDECIMIGDSDVDFRTAQNAGMLHIGVSWGYRDEAFLRSHGVSRIAHSAEELEREIKDLGEGSPLLR